MTYGSPSSLATTCRRYLTRVRGGRAPDAGARRPSSRAATEVIGGSPLSRITRAQAAALEADARRRVRASAPGCASRSRRSRTALRDWRPAVREASSAIVLSPQYSPLLMGGYGRGDRRGPGGDRAGGARWSPWPDAWHLRARLHRRARAAHPRGPRAPCQAERRADAPVLLTAHSLPRRVADQEPDYLDQLRDDRDAVAAAAGLTADRWTFCWQSAGHEPGEWMKPDFADLMPELAAAGHRSVLVAPVQFLADHLEILYDVDIGAREQAEASRPRVRTGSSRSTPIPAWSPRFAAVATATISSSGAVASDRRAATISVGGESR